MTEDLTAQPPETFLRLAVELGGLDLEEVVQDLSPEAADALRRIAAPTPAGPATRGELGRSLASLLKPKKGEPPPGPICPSCGHVNQSRDRFCRNCGRPLAKPAPAITLQGTVDEGRLSPEQAQEAEDRIALYLSHYTAGTRYSVFG